MHQNVYDSFLGISGPNRINKTNFESKLSQLYKTCIKWIQSNTRLDLVGKSLFLNICLHETSPVWQWSATGSMSSNQFAHPVNLLYIAYCTKPSWDQKANSSKIGPPLVQVLCEAYPVCIM